MALNRIIEPLAYAYCNGGYYDGMWMERLFKAAGVAPAIALRECPICLWLIGDFSSASKSHWVKVIRPIERGMMLPVCAWH